MQLARFPVGTDAVIIIHTVGQIGALLDLRDQNARTDRMERACLNKEHIALFDRHKLHTVEHGALLDRTAELILCQLSVEAAGQCRALIAVHDIPAFRLAVFALLVHTRIAVIRMHLHTEILPGVDQLDHHRECRQSCSTLSDTGSPVLFQIGFQRLPLEHTVHDDGFPCRMTGELPAFGNTLQIARLAVFVTQPCSAPDIVLKRRQKFQRFHSMIPFHSISDCVMRMLRGFAARGSRLLANS